jgi:hypothetical protein
VIPSALAGNTSQWLLMARVKPKPTALSRSTDSGWIFSNENLISKELENPYPFF